MTALKVSTSLTDWLTRQEAAAVLHCGVATLDRRLKACGIACLRHGRRVLVSKASLEAYLALCQVADTNKESRNG